MTKFFQAVFTMLTNYFIGNHTNTNRIADLLDGLIVKTKTAVEATQTAIAKEVQDRTDAIAQIVTNYTAAIATAASSLRAEFQQGFDLLKTRIDVIESMVSDIVQYQFNPSLPTQTVQDALANALGLGLRVVGSSKTYLLRVSGNGEGVMTFDWQGNTIELSAGEDLKIRTDANGNVVFAELYKNPTEEFRIIFLGYFRELHDRLEILAIANELLNAATKLKVDAAEARLNSF